VNHEVPGLQILEVGQERLGRGQPGRDDSLLGQDILLAKDVDLLLGETETALERSDEKADG